MPRKGVSKAKKENIKSKQIVANGISNTENNNDLSVENYHTTQEHDSNIDSKKKKDNVLKQGSDILENGSVVAADDIEVNSGINTTNLKQKKTDANENKESENNNDENLDVSEPENIIKSNNIEQKTVPGKHGRKKISKNESHSTKDNSEKIIESKISSNEECKITKTEDVIEKNDLEEKTVISRRGRKKIKDATDENQSAKNNSEIVENKKSKISLNEDKTENAVKKNALEEKSVISKRGRKKIKGTNENKSAKDNIEEIIENIELENGDKKERNVDKAEDVEKNDLEKAVTSKRGRKKISKDESQSISDSGKLSTNVRVDSEISSENPVVPLKKNVSKNSESEIHNEELDVSENVIGKDNLEGKKALGKRGRKKVCVDDAHSITSDQLHSSKHPVAKRKRNLKESDITSNLSTRDSEISDTEKEKQISVTNEEQGLETELDEKGKVSFMKEESLKKESSANIESLDTFVTKASSGNTESILPKKAGRKRKNEVLKPKEADNKTRQSDDDPSHNATTKNIKAAKVVIKRNKQTEKAAKDALKFQWEETSNKGEKDSEAPSDGGSGNAKSRKRKKDDGDEDVKKAKSTKESAKSKSSSKKEKIPDVTALDFSNNSASSSGKKWTLKLSSWNVNGIRAWLEKDGLTYLHHEKPDILCIQETKCSEDKLPEEVKTIDGYHTYWLAGDKDGYSGVGLISKEEPINVKYGIDMQEHDNEGRVITAEYSEFYLVAAYVPNAGRGLVRLDYRMQWDKDFRAYIKKLDNKKPVILCGDLNVAHEEIDLANPKSNKKNAGFTKEEREGFTSLLSEGYIDSYRYLYPDTKGAYTFWTYMMNARAKNVGWRLDYFVVSERFAENVCDSVIRKDVFGSDHCPIALFLAV